ncbi:putative small GTPase superfamily, ARF/SAR type, P-loop containing nucleoside triphosphate hydrolase [Helianthus annuus]|uniref:Small GTPase superfamily, ARF/SAR type, P-loop containing nucleoside triphosphate hydrolase n=1 Tax=Helianthus annuus TaxID=4232 RepID=A0A9K3H6V8_HELAN|nr:putative small GTPase superfamily, ARF/SAR type, P-loop containing nucleoside triphosphate hydrolase [Helianthus annuus]KAJ0485011.1 putative small GTPase superfamily, ARF/SAR type, P-loop containing nucleoside triphosphate hydrolase [Helianthus annuus]KAJ0655564.1 putative small GTPase superfamily, ARF/SAR type, P-loop containing nucleoside triphosphate hydrolase [Helianthus annuus]KAJ0839529.1 putative small GTPase superfamily, ARF/SAR type, P-loop containing nucleoside triphosphate hydrola
MSNIRISWIVDSQSPITRVVEARDELRRMLNEDAHRDVVLLVFANKICLMPWTQQKSVRDEYIKSTCATFGEELYKGPDWLSSNISNKPS